MLLLGCVAHVRAKKIAPARAKLLRAAGVLQPEARGCIDERRWPPHRLAEECIRAGAQDPRVWPDPTAAKDTLLVLTHQLTATLYIPHHADERRRATHIRAPRRCRHKLVLLKDYPDWAEQRERLLHAPPVSAAACQLRRWEPVEQRVT
eukprot:2541915-Prymnesium_polylepis.2